VTDDSADEMLSAMVATASTDAAQAPHPRQNRGNPFFMEEPCRRLFDDAALVRNGTVKLTSH